MQVLIEWRSSGFMENLFKCLGIARGPEFKSLKDAIWSVLSLKGRLNRLKVLDFCFFQGF